MAMETPGFANQSGSYSAEQTRRAVFAAYARVGSTPGIISGGLVGPTDCQLTAPGSGMSVNVSTGEMIIGGTEGAVQGGYYGRVSSTTNLTISAASPSNPRIDTVCGTVSDSGYTEPAGGSGDKVALQVVTGTPTSGATLTNLNGAATLPASSLLLGYVLVPTSATNIITADIANLAGVGPQGPWQPLALATNIVSSGYTAAARLENSVTVRLKGGLLNNTGSAANTLATIPVGLRPSSAVSMAAVDASVWAFEPVQITSLGSFLVQGSGIPNNDILSLNGLTYTIS